MNITFKIFFFLFLFQVGYGQIMHPVHLSFNLNESSSNTKRVTEIDGSIHFFICNEHFISKTSDSTLTKSEVASLDMINITDFKLMATKERERLIRSGEKKGKIKILFNHEVFHMIYLYIKIDHNLIKRYKVKWVEEIE